MREPPGKRGEESRRTAGERQVWREGIVWEPRSHLSQSLTSRPEHVALQSPLKRKAPEETSALIKKSTKCL